MQPRVKTKHKLEILETEPDFYDLSRKTPRELGKVKAVDEENRGSHIELGPNVKKSPYMILGIGLNGYL